MKNIITSLCILFFLIAPCTATEFTTIEIYYPNPNTTTQIYYAESGGYQSVLANNVSGNFTALIIKNEMEYDNIIESPHKIISPMFGLITLIILISFLIVAAKLIKKVWRR